MLRKITDIFREEAQTLSFELFPPKTDKGRVQLPQTVAALAELRPDWFSVTYGAGGSTREHTMEIVIDLQERFGIPTMHHLTCVGHSPAELRDILARMKQHDIHNILALFGDPPQDDPGWQPAPGAFRYCYELIRHIRSDNGFFSIGVAGFPEGHIDCPDRETDVRYLKAKLDAGADFVITQLFFDNQYYFDYVARARKQGVTARIIPGILPVTDYPALLRFCQRCGARIPQSVHDIFMPLDGNPPATYAAGVDFAVRQCRELLAGGAPGLHFFPLNKVEPAREIVTRLRMGQTEI
jgi:methylenetetrahydrofolate reductase (NADPH)